MEANLPAPTSYAVSSGVATITFTGAGDEKLPWKTPVREHRWDPRTVRAVREHLDAADADDSVSCVLVKGEGGMFGLCFDYRVMNVDAGFFFVPGIDLGLVYSSFQIELMKAKMPVHMHRKVIIYNSQRWTAKQLLEEHVVDQAVPASEVTVTAERLAQQLLPKGQGGPRKAMAGIKATVYKEVLAALHEDTNAGMMTMAGRSKGHAYAPPPTSSL